MPGCNTQAVGHRKFCTGEPRPPAPQRLQPRASASLTAGHAECMECEGQAAQGAAAALEALGGLFLASSQDSPFA
jgi:hypothetical protein